MDHTLVVGPSWNHAVVMIHASWITHFSLIMHLSRNHRVVWIICSSWLTRLMAQLSWIIGLSWIHAFVVNHYLSSLLTPLSRFLFFINHAVVMVHLLVMNHAVVMIQVLVINHALLMNHAVDLSYCCQRTAHLIFHEAIENVLGWGLWLPTNNKPSPGRNENQWTKCQETTPPKDNKLTPSKFLQTMGKFIGWWHALRNSCWSSNQIPPSQNLCACIFFILISGSNPRILPPFKN